MQAMIVVAFVFVLLAAQIVKVPIEHQARLVPYSSDRMRILQADVRSLTTTKDLLQLTAAIHQAKLLILQENHHPRKGYR